MMLFTFTFNYFLCGVILQIPCNAFIFETIFNHTILLMTQIFSGCSLQPTLSTCCYPIHSCCSRWLSGGCVCICACLERVCRLDKAAIKWSSLWSFSLLQCGVKGGACFPASRPRPCAMYWSPWLQWQACLGTSSHDFLGGKLFQLLCD